MRASICCIAMLMGVMGIATDAAAVGGSNERLAGKRGLSPITLDYAQSLIEGEELMFIMDVPSIPAQETPIVLAQTTPSEGGQPDYIFKDCQETENGGDPRSAMRSVDPAGMLAVYLGNQRNRDIYDNQTAMASIKVTMLQGTAHGKITTEIDNTGRTSYGYDPISNYQGKDKAIFMAEFEGKRYKIVVELHVFMDVAPGDFGASTCPPPQLIKVTKPSSGDTGYGDGYNISPVSITFADLAGAALGQTTGTTITLDTNK